MGLVLSVIPFYYLEGMRRGEGDVASTSRAPSKQIANIKCLATEIGKTDW